MTSTAGDVALSPGAACTAAVLGALTAVLVAEAPHSLMPLIEGEFGAVETISALAYPVGAFFAVKLARRTHGLHRAHWIMWTVLCVLFFGEETSWLQHWIGYATPRSVEALSTQEEFNLHNLIWFDQRDEIVGARPTWRLLLSAQLLFYAGFTTYFLLLPLVMRLRSVGRLGQRLGIPRIRTSFLAAVWLPVAASVALTLVYAYDGGRKKLIAETREMFFAIAIALFIALAYRAWRRSSASSR